MDTLPDSSMLQIIQASVTPVILISGMGLLLLTLTNRMGRLMDRTRLYADQIRRGKPDEQSYLDAQMEITWHRAKLIRLSLTFAATSMLLAAALVLVIFAGNLLHRDLGALMLTLFSASIVALVATLGTFLRDIFVSLEAVRLEVREARAHRQ